MAELFLAGTVLAGGVMAAAKLGACWGVIAYVAGETPVAPICLACHCHKRGERSDHRERFLSSD